MYPRAKASASRHAVYLYGKRTSCPGEYAFDILLDNTGRDRSWFLRLCASSTQEVRLRKRDSRWAVIQFVKLTAVQTVVVPCTFMMKQVAFSLKE